MDETETFYQRTQKGTFFIVNLLNWFVMKQMGYKPPNLNDFKTPLGFKIQLEKDDCGLEETLLAMELGFPKARDFFSEKSSSGSNLIWVQTLFNMQSKNKSPIDANACKEAYPSMSWIELNEKNYSPSIVWKLVALQGTS